MKELVIISGKGGTGKTSVAASFAVLAENAIVADCDVDAADLHLILEPKIKERAEFFSGYQAVINPEQCIGCGVCLEQCRFGAILGSKEGDSDCLENKISIQGCDTGSVLGLRQTQDGEFSQERELVVGAGFKPALINEEHSNVPFVQERPKADRCNSFSEHKNGRCLQYHVDPISCEGCGVCARFCPSNAVQMKQQRCGEVMVSDTRSGLMIHAHLGVAAENSGKLVSEVRRIARCKGEERRSSLIIVDGPPGIGCPVIASITGSSMVLLVTEPTVSGEHDMKRVLGLASHFKISVAVCVNKWDLNPSLTEKIEETAKSKGAHIAGRIRYDRGVTLAQIEGKAVVETITECVADFIGIWSNIKEKLNFV